MNTFESLADAIILQAAEDYRKAQKALSRNDQNSGARETIEECESFFRSTWFSSLTSLNGEYLIKKLRGEIQ